MTMPLRTPPRRQRRRQASRFERDWKFFRPLVETLEDRTLLDSGVGSTTPTVIVGRTLSAYFAGNVQGGKETITYTVYNEQADDETGVLLTTTLEPGVTIDSASINSGVTTPLPDQQGQNLAWSLGTIQGYDRASVTLVVDLASTSILQLDSGAKAYATLDAGAVSASTPAATLRAGSPADPSLLASTPDANTTDPFVQEEAAALGYDPTAIFNFLHDQIGYNSYLGSVRGARGTLWSDAGNALDVASLGVALMRASGVPAQYVEGTLPSYVAQTLILSMFPTSYQTVGYIPAGTQTADPKDDPQLLSETESHYWYQFDAGQSFVDADPLLSSTTGRTYTTAGGTFAEVPDSLREKTEVSLAAEIYSQAIAAFGRSALQTTTVLDQAFNDVDIVGKPLTFGNLVTSTSQGGLAFSTVTNNYAPYIEQGDEANPNPSQDKILRGTDYQEVLTNFPLGSRLLTGLFLNIILTGPEGASKTYTRTLLDRIGYTARQSGGSVQLPPIDPTGPPALSDLDLFTINSLSASDNPASPLPLIDTLNRVSQQLDTLVGGSTGGVPADNSLAREYFVILGRLASRDFLDLSNASTKRIASGAAVTAYFDRPRQIIVSTQFHVIGQSGTITLTVDLRNDHIRVLAYPGQNSQATYVFNITNGVAENVVERKAGTDFAPTGSQQSSVNTATIIEEATNQHIPLKAIAAGNQSEIAFLNVSAEAKARITTAINNGYGVIVPSQMVMINGVATTAWYETDLRTGETMGVTEDGGHLEAIEYGVFASAALHGFIIAEVLFSGIPPFSPATPGQKATAGAIVAAVQKIVR